MGMVTFVDETTVGERRGVRELEFAEERLALREVIRRRVVREAEEYNAGAGAGARGGDEFRGWLLRPVELAAGRAGAVHEPIDPERQFQRAVEAFGRNGFLVLVGERQVEDLDAEVELPPGTEITFLELVPLVGG
ncbi:hypothetical protein [Streptomyces sp. NPDC087300]|uniref:hypothetical protein n=1 Tax=Streptomyces sp. NPDC087300 TaxID=3365780 RepID=UPI0037F92CF9